jgi:hypothetical protein
MDYKRLLSRAWYLLWEHKFMILLGDLVALGNSGRERMVSRRENVA